MNLLIEINNLALLFESKLDFIAKSQGEQIFRAHANERGLSSAWVAKVTPELKIKQINNIMSELSQISQKYLQWVVNQYIKGQFKLEDANRLKTDIMEFERIRSKIENKDLNSYKDLNQLYNAIEPFAEQEVVSNKKTDEKEKQRLLEKEATLIYKDETITVIVPKTQQAACYFGKGTKWCTSARDDNAFEQYNKEGPLYIISTNTGEKYQFHFETEQFMDARDQEIDTIALVKKYPNLYNAFKNIATEYAYLPLLSKEDQTENVCLRSIRVNPATLVYVKNQTEKICLEAVSINGNVLQYVKNQTEKICLAAVAQYGDAIAFVKNQTEKICLAAVKNSPFALRYVNTEFQTEDVCLTAAKGDSGSVIHIEDKEMKLKIKRSIGRPHIGEF